MLRVTRGNAILVIGLAILSGCNNPNSDICTSISPLDINKASDEAVAGRSPDPPEQCVHRWSYRLASAPGTNTEIAKAAVAACAETIDYAAMPFDKKFAPNPREYESAVNELSEEILQQALFRVVQARAGNCAIP